MRRAQIGPLGVDLGRRRIRVALGERRRDGTTTVRAVAARELPTAEAGSDTAQEIWPIVIEDLLRELDVNKRDCVAALGPPAASVRAVRFPKMTHVERKRAAAFQAEETSPDERVTRLHAIDVGSRFYAVATASSVRLRTLVDTLRRAGLRVVAVDYDGCALARVFPDLEAVLDIGHEISRLHVLASSVPVTATAAVGGATVTRAIASDLAIDLESAEHRKRILGATGLTVGVLDEFVEGVASLLRGPRFAPETFRVGVVGNGSRIPELAEIVAERCGVRVKMNVPSILQCSRFPEDVLGAATPDWALAAALLTWTAA